MKKVIKVSSIIILLFLVLTTFSSVTASDPTDITKFIGKTTSVTKDEEKVLNSVLSIIQVIGISVATIMLIALAIKYMVSSVADRAEIKKHAVVYVVGAILMFGASGIVQIIKAFSKNIGE